MLAALASPAGVLPAQQPARYHGLFGEVAVEIRPSAGEGLQIGVAAERGTVEIRALARDARRWADSTDRLLRLRAPRPHARSKRAKATLSPVRRLRAILEEPGIGGGSMVVARVDSAGATAWTFFMADTELERVSQTLPPGDVRALVSLIRRAAHAADPPRPRPRPQRGKSPTRTSGGR